MATILFFGRLSDASRNLKMNLPESVKTTDHLVAWLGDNNAALKTQLENPGNRIAVNKEIIKQAVPVSDTDEIAFMSPLSGG